MFPNDYFSNDYSYFTCTYYIKISVSVELHGLCIVVGQNTELLRLEQVSFVTKKSRLRWFGQGI